MSSSVTGHCLEVHLGKVINHRHGALSLLPVFCILCSCLSSTVTFSGIKEVIFMSDKYHDSEETTAARLMFKLAGVTFR